ncbi:MAG: hypothetical protein FWG08_05760 [Propionibacteriaceae bacterium]|jgi:predicted nucleic acid-binding protein|nr:hypothetical protein [Propionibacteriaceae bacterium]
MTSVLVDTSVWSEHFRQSQPALTGLLESGLALTHDLIIEELALSFTARHMFILKDISQLEVLPTASREEYLAFVASHNITGRRIGCVDTHLLISCALSHARIWTLDKHLTQAAQDCGMTVFPAS